MRKFLIAVAAAVPVIGTAAASVSAQAGPTALAATPAQRVNAATRKVHNDVVFTQTINQHQIVGKQKAAIYSSAADGDLAKTLDH